MTNHKMDRALNPDSAPTSTPGRPTDHAKVKAGWPKTPDGTIDWETVFETPNTGLIAMLADVGNHELLFKVTGTIIRQLFTRKGDELEVERFLRELTKIVGNAEKNGDDVGETRDAVIDLLRRIKNGRVKKAAAYVAEQKRKEALGEKQRRRAQRREADRATAVRNRMMMMAGGGLAAVVAIIGVVFVLSGGDGLHGEDNGEPVVAETAPAPDTTVETQDSWGRYDPTVALTRESEVSVKKDPKRAYTPNGYPLGRMAAEDLTDLGPHVMTLPPVLFSRNVGAGNSRQTMILPVLSIRDPDQWSNICTWAPSLTEAISAVMVRAIPATGDIDPSAFRSAGEVAMQLMNNRLGSVLVDDVFLLYDVDYALIKSDAGCALVGEG